MSVLLKISTIGSLPVNTKCYRKHHCQSVQVTDDRSDIHSSETLTGVLRFFIMEESFASRNCLLARWYFGRLEISDPFENRFWTVFLSSEQVGEVNSERKK